MRPRPSVRPHLPPAGPGSAATVVLLGGTIRTDRDRPWLPGTEESARWLAEELSRREYQPSLWERFSQWFDRLFESTLAGRGPLGIALMALAALAVVLLIGLLLTRAGRLPNTRPGRRQGHGLWGSGTVSAAAHRLRAEQAWSVGDHRQAVIEAYRAIAAGAVERGDVAVKPHHTADDVAQLLARGHPDRWGELRVAAGAFDRALYGGRTPQAREARSLLDLEVSLREPALGGRHR